MHKNPLKSAGFKVLKAPGRAVGADRTRLCFEQDDLKQLTSGTWQAKTATSIAQAVDTYFSTRTAGTAASAGGSKGGR